MASRLIARLLGGFRLELDGELLFDDASPRRKPLALIKLLALAPGHQLTRDDVLTALWPSLPPDRAATQLRKNRLLLRQAGVDGPTGDLVQLKWSELSLPNVQVDTDDFRAAAAKAFERRTDAEAFNEALALYAGDLLPGDMSEDWTTEPRLALRALYHGLLIELSAMQKAAGAIVPAVETLNRLLASEPVHEGAHRSLMELHAHVGRRDLALAQFERCREALRRELDVEPDEKTRALSEEIRRGWVVHVETRPDDFFVGRSAEMARLRLGLDRVLRGRSAVMVITGEAGIGKTRLAESFAAHATEAGAQVHWLRVYEDAPGRGFDRWIALIRSLEASRPDVDVSAGAARSDQQQSRIHALLSSNSTVQETLFKQVSEFLVERARARPLVLLIDDLQWMGPDSLYLLLSVIRETRNAPFMVVSTVRSELADTPPEAREPIDALVHDRHSEVLALRALSLNEVEGLVALSKGREAERLSRAVWTRTGGNPLFVAEVLRSLESDRDQTLRSLRIPPKVTGVIRRRILKLSSECRDILPYIAALGGEFDASVLSFVSDVPHAKTVVLLEEMVRNHILVQLSESAERFAFHHPLIREVMYEDISLQRRAELHLAIARALETYYGAQISAHTSELSHHYLLGAAAGGVQQALRYLEHAGLQALAELSFEEAARLFGSQLELALIHRSRDPAYHGEIRLRLGAALYRTYDGSQRRHAEDALALALGDARSSGSASLFVRVVAAMTGKRESSLGVRADRIALLREALAVVEQGDIETRCLLSGQLAKEREGDPDDAVRVASGRAAIDLALQLAPGEISGQAIVHGLDAIGGPDTLDERLGLTERLVAFTLPHGESVTLQARLRRYAALLEATDVDGADRELGHIVTACERHPISTVRKWAERWSAALAGDRLALSGRFEEAEEEAQRAMALGQAMQDPDALSIFGSQLFQLRWHQGRLQELADLARNVLKDAPDFWPWRVAAILIELNSGEEHLARAAFERLAANHFRPIPRDRFWSVTMTVIGELCARLEDQQRAAEVLEMLRPYEGRVSILGYGQVCGGANARVIGILYTTLNAWDDAQDAFERAVSVNAGIGALSWSAWTYLNYGEMLLRRRRTGDVARARSLLSSAIEIARERGMAGVRARAEPILATIPSGNRHSSSDRTGTSG